MKASDLKANKRNPRTITAGRKEGLRKSVFEFGDLGGIIFNERDGKLYGGHQRLGVIDPNAPIEIVKRYKKPTRAGTVGEGYLTFEGERFAVRLVDWTPKKASAAMIAANQHRGEWDQDILALEIKEHGLFEDDGAAMLGFDADEMERFLSRPAASVAAEGARFEAEVAAPTAEERAARQEALVAAAAAHFEAQPEPTAEEAHNAFDAVEEKTEIAGRREVIIIDFERKDLKEAFKEKLRAEKLLEPFGGKIF